MWYIIPHKWGKRYSQQTANKCTSGTVVTGVPQSTTVKFWTILTKTAYTHF